MKTRVCRFLLVCFGLYFLSGCLWSLSGLGLNLDEGYVGLGALDLIDGFAGRRPLVFPLMESFYVGFILRYLTVPFVLVGSNTAFALRLFPVVCSLCSLLLMFYVLRRLFDRAVALTAVGLLAVNSTFIRSVRHGNQREEFLQIFFVWLGLSLIERAKHKNSTLCVWGAGFVWGLALWAKLMFLGYIVGFVLAFAVFFVPGRRYLKCAVFPDKSSLVGFCAAFVSGAFPLILFNIQNSWVTITSILHRLFAGEFAGWDNLRLISNLKTRAWDFVWLLEDQFTWMDSFTSSIRNEWWLCVFFAALCVVLSYIFSPSLKKTYARSTIGAFLLVYFGVWISTLFIPQAHTPEHLVLMMPVAEIVVALGLWLVIRACRVKIAAVALAAVLLAPHVVIESRVLASALKGAQKGQGFGEWSGVVYELADWIDENADRPVLSPFYIYGSLYYLTGGGSSLISASVIDEVPNPEKIYNEKLVGLESFYFLRPVYGTHVAEFYELMTLLENKGMVFKPIVKKSSAHSEDFEFEILLVEQTGAAQ